MPPFLMDSTSSIIIQSLATIAQCCRCENVVFVQMQFLLLLLDGATSFAKLSLKISKSSKIGGKVCAHDFVKIAELRDVKKIPLQ